MKCIPHVLAKMQVETTVAQAIVRVLSTGLGCLIGWALLSDSKTATDPVLVRVNHVCAHITIVCVCVFNVHLLCSVA